MTIIYSSRERIVYAADNGNNVDMKLCLTLYLKWDFYNFSKKNLLQFVKALRRGNCEKSRKEDELNQGSGKHQLGMEQERPEKGLDSTRQ